MAFRRGVPDKCASGAGANDRLIPGGRQGCPGGAGLSSSSSASSVNAEEEIGEETMITTTCLVTLWLLGSTEAGNAAAVEARRLASVPQDAKLKGVFQSPDPRRVGLIAKRGAKEFAVLDGIPGEEFDAISSALTFSPNAHSVAYIARNGGEQFAILNGFRSEGYDSILSPTFSPDSSRFVYAAAKGSRRYLILDGRRAS